MAYNEALAERIRQRLARRKNVEEKKTFSESGFLLNGNLLVGVRKDSLLVRLGAEQREEALQEAHVSEFKITGWGAMKGWVVVSLEGAIIRAWDAHARQLPRPGSASWKRPTGAVARQQPCPADPGASLRRLDAEASAGRNDLCCFD